MGPKLYNSIKKYGFQSHQKEIIEECSEDKLLERETFWKEYYKVLEIPSLCCMMDGKGGRMDQETKDKIRNALLGRKITWKAGRKAGFNCSEEQKEKLRIPKSEDTKLKMRKPRSEEAKKNMKYPKSEQAKINMRGIKETLICPIYSKEGRGNIMHRFHFNNCKF